MNGFYFTLDIAEINLRNYDIRYEDMCFAVILISFYIVFGILFHNSIHLFRVILQLRLNELLLQSSRISQSWRFFRYPPLGLIVSVFITSRWKGICKFIFGFVANWMVFKVTV